MDRTLSAPGKLFVAGEYAVLWGGTAWVLAVGPRGEARVRRRDDRRVVLAVSEGRLEGTATPLGVRWHDPVTPPFRFAARALDVAFRAHGREVLGLGLALAPSVPGPGGQKLGLGGSARTVVLAMEAACGVLDVRPTLPLAILAHSEAQEVPGSGADVVTSVVGGLIRYRRYPVERLAVPGRPLLLALGDAGPVDVVRRELPVLPLAYAFAGTSAATGPMIAAAERALDQGARSRFVAESDQLGEALEEGLRTGAFASVRESCEGLQTLLGSVGPVITPGVRRVLALAESAGSTGKPSGAGGGDGCLLVSPSAEAQRELLATLSARNLLAMPLEAEPGVRTESRGSEQLGRWLAD